MEVTYASDSHAQPTCVTRVGNPFNTPPVFPQEPASVIQPDLYAARCRHVVFHLLFPAGFVPAVSRVSQLEKAS